MEQHNTPPEDIVLLADFDDLDVESFISETIGSAIIDCGCSSSVCGELWLKTYKDTLSCKEKESIVYNSSNRWYRFGDGKKVKAIKKTVFRWRRRRCKHFEPFKH